MLKEFREKQKISQDKLAEITGIDRKTIFRIENDLNYPQVDNYAKIVIALKLTDKQIADNIREIAYDKYEKEENKNYDEKNCIYNINGNYCECENTNCFICKDKKILKENEEVQVKETIYYKLKNENGRIIKKDTKTIQEIN